MQYNTEQLDQPRSIVLVGLMGSGKTAIGKRLAASLSLPFHDSDEAIEAEFGMSISEIFIHHGEPAFRAAERRIIASLLAGPPIVLSTGGGAFMDEKTRSVIAGKAWSVWLRASVPVLLRRVSGKRHRPLLSGADPAETLQKLSVERNPVYASADLIVDSTEAPHAMTVKAVLDAIAKHSEPRIIPVEPAGGPAYDVIIGQSLLRRVGSLLAAKLPQRQVIVVTDPNVAAHHLPTLIASLNDAGFSHHTITAPAGEASKSLKMYGTLIEQVLATRPERGTTVIALGGGVIGDLAGFIAATALRGLPFVQIPTTLLAQIDSSVGGKTGINSASGKNLIGSFHQPRCVLIDLDTLTTLPARERAAGYAEIVKAGLIADPDLYHWCAVNGAPMLRGNVGLQEQAIARAITFKARIVTEDPFELRAEGGRALLNLGHTFAHALEVETGYIGSLLHGEAVAIGLVCAFDLSARLGHCPPDLTSQIAAHLNSVGLPVRIGSLSVSKLLAHMKSDKKMRNGNLTFVLAHAIGHAFTSRDVPESVVRATLLANGAIDR